MQIVYTVGMKALAEEHGAYWLLDVVVSHLTTNRKLRAEPFQLWRLKLDGEGGCVVSAHRDKGEPAIVEQAIEYTDFPHDFEWYVCEGEAWCIMLKEEY